MSTVSPICANASPAATTAPPASGHARAATGTLVIATVARQQGDTGVQTHSQALLHGFGSAGIPCKLQTPFSGSLKWLPIFAVRPVLLSRVNKTWSTRWYRRWHAAALRENLIRCARRGPIAAVVAQCPLSAMAALEARSNTGGNFAIAMVCHFNHSEATEYRQRGELPDDRYFQQMLDFERRVMESVDRVIYVSAWARRVVEEERHIRPIESAVIWNGILADLPPPRLSRADLGLAHDDLVLMNVGTLEPRKNQMALVESFASLAREFGRAKLVLVGDGPARREICNRIAALKLETRVLLAGLRRDVPDLLGLADVYVHFSSAENCPMVLLEAARAGLPIAAVAAGGVPELLAELGGVPLPADTAGSLAVLRPLLADNGLRARLGRSARETFHRRFTVDAMAAEYRRVLGFASPAREGIP